MIGLRLTAALQIVDYVEQMAVFGPRDDGVWIRRRDDTALQSHAATLHFTSTGRTSRDPWRHYNTSHTHTLARTLLYIRYIKLQSQQDEDITCSKSSDSKKAHAISSVF